jgi:four helix bundle protein
MRSDKPNLIVDRTLQFSLKIMNFAEELEKQRKYVFANQILKSRTSIGTNVRESQNAESKADFIHKMKIAAKEADETEYWLTLCSLNNNYPDSPELLSDIKELIKIISKIISSSKQ